MTQADMIKEIDYTLDSIESLLRRIEMDQGVRNVLTDKLYEFYEILEAATN